eukprot:CAMPEP_0113246986 /NCGR_PEP_ID=MMETSP0008_2-20120614/9748_1 /TAXON_ID=97485 /ORGANISM="Prymnesium parvum" /LENGTH=455 /DNA_ID=CAMNT_0000094749 /DNA_START=534 /DNA_END=1900 /DNA_ORIENTATION=+ /assembly_acc=CAM_ASM_000153
MERRQLARTSLVAVPSGQSLRVPPRRAGRVLRRVERAAAHRSYSLGLAALCLAVPLALQRSRTRPCRCCVRPLGARRLRALCDAWRGFRFMILLATMPCFFWHSSALPSHSSARATFAVVPDRPASSPFFLYVRLRLVAILRIASVPFCPYAPCRLVSHRFVSAPQSCPDTPPQQVKPRVVSPPDGLCGPCLGALTRAPLPSVPTPLAGSVVVLLTRCCLLPNASCTRPRFQEQCATALHVVWLRYGAPRGLARAGGGAAAAYLSGRELRQQDGRDREEHYERAAHRGANRTKRDEVPVAFAASGAAGGNEGGAEGDSSSDARACGRAPTSSQTATTHSVYMQGRADRCDAAVAPRERVLGGAGSGRSRKMREPPPRVSPSSRRRGEREAQRPMCCCAIERSSSSESKSGELPRCCWDAAREAAREVRLPAPPSRKRRAAEEPKPPPAGRNGSSE